MTDQPKAEIIEPSTALIPDTGIVGVLARADQDTQIATARRFPRDIRKARDAIAALVTLDEHVAAACIYALPRGGKPIKGPSIRFAEIVLQNWDNSFVDSWIQHVDREEKVVVAKAIFRDLEKNITTRGEETRRIVDKHGKLYSDDMIIVTGKAACAIAKRNAILGGVSQAWWGQAYDSAEAVVAGDTKTMTERRERAFKAFAVLGVTAQQIFTALEIKSADDMTPDHLTTLQGMHSAIKNGEATVEELFTKAAPSTEKAWQPPPADEATHDAQTGEIIDADMTISKIDLIVSENVVEDWQSWGRRFVQRIAAAPTAEHVDEWRKANQSMLDSMRQDTEKGYKLVESAINRRVQELRQKDSK